MCAGRSGARVCKSIPRSGSALRMHHHKLVIAASSLVTTPGYKHVSTCFYILIILSWYSLFLCLSFSISKFLFCFFFLSVSFLPIFSLRLSLLFSFSIFCLCLPPLWGGDHFRWVKCTGAAGNDMFSTSDETINTRNPLFLLLFRIDDD